MVSHGRKTEGTEEIPAVLPLLPFRIVYEMSRINRYWTWEKSLFWNTLYEGSINSSSRVRLHGNSPFG